MKNIAKTVKNFFDMIGRILKGAFWFPVGKSLADVNGVIIDGDPDALPRTDPFWRDQWKWIVLFTPHPTPFVIYFETDEVGSCMGYFNKICTSYVAVRVGPHAVKVVALSDRGCHADVLQLDVFFPPTSEVFIREALAYRSLLSKTTWV